jgi:hypothetical chaperone protein
MHVGLDFGTTNSALAVADEDGAVTLRRFAGRDVFRSILCFDAEERDARKRPRCTAGNGAVDAWLKSQGASRLVQSVKSHLASRSFTSTRIFHWTATLEDLVAEIVLQLRAAAAEGKPLPGRAVVGRPVRFVRGDGSEDEEADALACGRLLAALRAAGFDDVQLELEPVAAAWSFAKRTGRAGRDALVLVGDFGGGTSDFCVVELGAQGGDRVRATVGVPAAGDVLDQRILEHVVAPHLGKGTKHRVLGGDADVPLWLYQHLARWHRLSFLKSKRTTDLLDELVATAHDAFALERLRRLVDEDLGFSLHKAVEGTKVALSSREAARLSFPELDLDVEVERADFERWIEDDVARFGDAVDQALAKAGVAAVDVDRVFLTGGTSLVPAVQRVFAERFDAAKIEGGDELTSVAAGLALAARERG